MLIIINYLTVLFALLTAAEKKKSFHVPFYLVYLG